MIYTQINPDEINKMYRQIAVVSVAAKHLSLDDMLFTKTIAREITRLTIPTEYSEDIFKLEMCHCIEQTANLDENRKMFGLPWFASATTFLSIINLITETVNNNVKYT